MSRPHPVDSSRLLRPARFTSTADASLLRDRALPLPYDRDSLAPGAALPTRDVKFLLALLAARSIHFDDRGTSLGDALLALSHLQALRDAASLFGLRLPVTASPRMAGLLNLPATTQPPPRALRIRPMIDPPAVRTATQTHADLPARRYLAVERRLGLRLPRNRGFLPALSSRSDDHGPPLICYIAASAWSRKKNYGARGYALVARSIDAIVGRGFDHVLVQGVDDVKRPPAPLRLSNDQHDLAALLELFARATLVIGNDTGLLHAAAMTKSDTRLGVIGIYGRHSYFRYTTGDPRHYAIATPFAQAMAFSDGSPQRDRIADEWYPRAAGIRRIPPKFIAECAVRVLAGAVK